VIFIKTITIITPANIEVEYRLAGAGSRLAAFICDYILQMLILLVLVLAIIGVDYLLQGRGNFILSTTAEWVIIVVVFLIQFGYFIVSELAMRGQTIGKKIFGLRAIRENGQPVEFTQILVRSLIRPFVDMLAVGLFFIIFNSKHKRVGDLAAGTIVISEKQTAKPIAHPWPDFLPSKFDLTEPEINLVEEWLSRRISLADNGEAIGRKLLEYFKSREESSIEDHGALPHTPPSF